MYTEDDWGMYPYEEDERGGRGVPPHYSKKPNSLYTNIAMGVSLLILDPLLTAAIIFALARWYTLHPWLLALIAWGAFSLIGVLLLCFVWIIGVATKQIK